MTRHPAPGHPVDSTPTDVAPWSRDSVADWLLNVSHLRLVTTAPYLGELLSPGFLSDLAHPRVASFPDTVPPLAIRHGGNRYFLPGSARDLVDYLSCVVACIPTILRGIDRQETADYGPPSIATAVTGRSGDARAMRGAWSRLDATVRHRLSTTGSHVVITDIERFGESIDASRLTAELATLGADPDVIAQLDRMHRTWERHGFPGLPLTGGVSILGKFWLAPVDETLRGEGIDYIRIQDDFRIFAPDKDGAERALATLGAAVGKLGMTLNPSKTRMLGPGPEAWAHLRRTNSVRRFREGILRPLLGESLRWRAMRPVAVRVFRLLNRGRDAASRAGQGTDPGRMHADSTSRRSHRVKEVR